MNRFLKLNQLKKIFTPNPTAITPVNEVVEMVHTPTTRTDGSQLFIIKLIAENGPLTTKEIWNEYQRQIELAKQAGSEFPTYFKSLNNLKQKVLAPMRERQKVISKGYSKVGNMHLGWQLNQLKAYKNIHPQLKKQLRQKVAQTNERQALKEAEKKE